MNVNKRYVILLFAYGNFWSAVCISLQAPFFPSEAERKGATASEYGLVFGIYELGIIILSPLFSKLSGRVKTESMISLGLLIVGTAVVSFGFLDRAPDGRPFVIMALAIRLVESIGCILFNVFNFTAVAALYPNEIASSFSILQTGYGIGLLAGPTIGALLYDLGGFTLPFVVLGSFLLLGAGASFAVLPAVGIALDKTKNITINNNTESHITSYKQRKHSRIRDAHQDYENNTCIDDKTLLSVSSRFNSAKSVGGPILGVGQVLSSVGRCLDLAAIVVTFSYIGFNAAALEPHLRQFNLSVIFVGFVFIVDGAFFAALSPVVGKLCDRGLPPKAMILAGHCVALLGVSLAGPLPGLGLQASLPLVLSALALVGVSVALKFVPAFFNTLHEALGVLASKHGACATKNDEQNVYALVTSLVYSCGSLGSFVGPSIGGYLYEHFGYAFGTLVFASAELLLLLVALCHLWRFGCYSEHLRRKSLGDAEANEQSALITSNKLTTSYTISSTFDGNSITASTGRQNLLAVATSDFDSNSRQPVIAAGSVVKQKTMKQAKSGSNESKGLNENKALRVEARRKFASTAAPLVSTTTTTTTLTNEDTFAQIESEAQQPSFV